jgi:hypothetical protein
LPKVEQRKVRKDAQRYILRKGVLFRRDRGLSMPRRVIEDPKERERILNALNEEPTGGHRGITATFNKTFNLYYWPRLFDPVKKHCSSCDACQRRDLIRPQEPMHPTWSINAWRKVHIDVVTVAQSDDGYRYIIAARDDLTGWIEAKMLRSKNKEEFIESHIVPRYGPPEVIVSDNGELNSEEAFKFCRNHEIQLRLRLSDYHPQANGIVERGHKPIVDALMKYSQDKPEDWQKYIYSALWADRVTTRRSTGYSPFFLLYGYHCPSPNRTYLPSDRLEEHYHYRRLTYSQNPTAQP